MWVPQKEYRAVGTVLVTARERAGLTQAQLAKRLAKPQSFVSSYERGQRRIDLLELVRIAHVLDADPRKLYSAILKAMGNVRF